MILIAGGKDKGGSYGFIAPLADRIKALVLIGEARQKIEAELGPVSRPMGRRTSKGRWSAPEAWQGRAIRCSSLPCARASTCSRTTRRGEMRSDTSWRPCEEDSRPCHLIPLLLLPLPGYDRGEDAHMLPCHGMRIRRIAHRSAIPACLQISPHRALLLPFPRAHRLSGLEAACGDRGRGHAPGLLQHRAFSRHH